MEKEGREEKEEKERERERNRKTQGDKRKANGAFSQFLVALSFFVSKGVRTKQSQ